MVNAIIFEGQYKNYGTFENPIVSIKDAIELEKVGKDTIYRRINNGTLRTKKININTKNQYLGKGVYLSGLSPDAQRRYFEGFKTGLRGIIENAKLSLDTAESNEIQKTKMLDEIPDYNRANAFYKLSILENWSNYESSAVGKFEIEKLGKVKAMDAFLCEIAKQNGNETISRSTFYEWLSRYKTGGVSRLATDYGKASGIWENHGWSIEAKRLFDDLYLQQSKPTAKECYKKILREGKMRNWRIPTYKTILRYIESIPYSRKVFEREGQKMFNDKILPYFDRNPESIAANEVWVADHHQLDIAIKWWDGSIIFPWVTMFIDMRSWKIVGWAITNTPNSQSIMTALKRGITLYGIPDFVYLDNGKDFVSRQFTGGELRIGKVLNNEEKIVINGIYKELKIQVKNALPRNPQAKTIERLFGTIEAQFGKFSKGYRGNRVSNRPEQLKREIENGNLYSISQFRNMFEDYVKFYNSEQGGEQSKYLKGMSPDECYAANLKKSPIVNTESLRLLMMPLGDNEVKTVQRNGIYLRQFNRWYKTPAELEIKTKIIARYEIDDLSKIYVYDTNKRLLAVCEEREQTHILSATKEDFHSVNLERKNLKNLVRENRKTRKKELEALNLNNNLRIDEKTSEVINERTGEKIIFETPYDNAIEKMNEERQKKEKDKEEKNALVKTVGDKLEESKKLIIIEKEKSKPDSEKDRIFLDALASMAKEKNKTAAQL